MKIAVIGSRDFNRRAMVEAFVRSLPQDWVVVSGGAVGVDSWGVAAALARGMETIVHLPRYDRYHPSVAPKERNRLIVDDADLLVGFWNGASTGTLDAVRLAVERRKPVRLVRAQDGLPSVEDLVKLTSRR